MAGEEVQLPTPTPSVHEFRALCGERVDGPILRVHPHENQDEYCRKAHKGVFLNKTKKCK